jgi:hypothetical protein
MASFAGSPLLYSVQLQIKAHFVEMGDTDAHAAPSLLQLPPEILLNILSQVASPSSPSAIQPVLYVCKQLYQVALPLSVRTYRNIESIGNPGFGRLLSRTPNALFLRYILITKPELAGHVKQLTLGCFSVHPNYPGLRKEEVEVYRGLIQEEASLSHIEGFKDYCLSLEADLLEGSVEAEVAVMLLTCKRLQIVCLEDPDDPEQLEHLFQILRKSHPLGEAEPHHALPLSCLTEFYHESQDEKFGYTGFSSLGALALTLPRLRSYECVMANGGDGSADDFLAISRRSSPVEEILLRKSCVTAETFESIVGACKALKVLEYTRGVYHMYDRELMPRDLLNTTLPHAKTLEHLHVNFEDDWDKGSWVDEPEKIYMGVELQKMTQLKRLVVGMQPLTGLLARQPEEIFNAELPLEIEGAPKMAQCLPDSLVHLEIHGCGSAILGQVQDLLHLIETGARFQNLKRLRLLFNAEDISAGEIRLSCSSPRLTLETVLETKDNRTYNLAPSYYPPDHSMIISNICSRIFSEKLREQWLNIRGTGLGSATANSGLYEAPGLKIAAQLLLP